MKKSALILLISGAILNAGCYTYTSYSGKKHIQLFPVREKITPNDIDTSMFVKQAFVLLDYNGKVARSGGKKVIEGLSGKDVQLLTATRKRYVVYLLDPQCPGSTKELRKLDSMSKHGQQVLVVSMRYNYKALDNLLSKTSFSDCPYYVIENEHYSNVLIQREKDFKTEVCGACYPGAGLAAANYLLIDSGVLKAMKQN